MMMRGAVRSNSRGGPTRGIRRLRCGDRVSRRFREIGSKFESSASFHAVLPTFEQAEDDGAAGRGRRRRRCGIRKGLAVLEALCQSHALRRRFVCPAPRLEGAERALARHAIISLASLKLFNFESSNRHTLCGTV